MDQIALDKQRAQSAFITERNMEELAPYLRIHAPNAVHSKGRASRQEVDFTFSRSREIELDWESLRKADVELTPEISAFKAYMQRSWVNSAPTAEDVKTVGDWEAASTFVFRGKGVTAQAPAGDFTPGKWQLERAAPTEIALRHRRSERLYLVTPVDPAQPPDFLGDYAKAWDRVKLIELAATNTSDQPPNETPFTEVETFDLNAAAIQKEFYKLNSRLEFYVGLQPKIQEFLGRISPMEQSSAAFQATVAQYVSLMSEPSRIRGQIQQLVDRAHELGYYLATRKTKLDEVPNREGPQELLPGELFVNQNAVARWTTQHHVHIRHLHVLGWTQHHSLEYVKFERFDPLHALLSFREKLGKVGKRALTCSLTDEGYVTDSGETLRGVMRRCDQDETYRRTCVILLPRYAPSLAEGTVLTSYLVIHNPLPGYRSLAVPRAYLQETLAYRAGWLGTELGPLSFSLNLAPGEARTVTLSQEAKQETTSRRSVTSLLDLKETQSSDFASEFERESRREFTKASSLNWNVKAKGSYGPFSASAGAGGTHSTKLTTFSRNLAKVARSAASSVTRRSKQEITTESSTSMSVSEGQSSTLSLRNVNDGRALNLLFYRLDNVYSGGTFLEGLEFVLVSETELIEGTGIREPKTFRLQGLNSFLGALTDAPSFDTSANLLRLEVLHALQELIREEYTTTEAKQAPLLFSEQPLPGSSSAETMFQRAPKKKGKLNWRQAWPAQEASETDEAYKSRLEALRVERTRELSQWLTGFEHLGRALNQHEFSVPSGAMYLDCLLGVQPATELFSERMREQEFHKNAAQIAIQNSRAYLNNARAHRIRWGKRQGVPQNSITRAHLDFKWGVTVLLEHPLAEGEWTLRYDAEQLGKLSPYDVGARRVELSWSNRPTFVTEAFDWELLSVVDESSGVGIFGQDPAADLPGLRIQFLAWNRPNSNRNELDVRLSDPLPAGKWELWFADKPRLTLGKKYQGASALELEWDQPQTWLGSGRPMECLELRELVSGTVVR